MGRFCKMLSLVFLSALAATLVLAQGKTNGSKPAAAASAEEIQKGKAVYDFRCAVCHFAKSDAKKIGPGMKGLAKRGTYANGKSVDDASLREWIEKGGKDMPGFKQSLTAEQIRDLIVYLKTL